MFLAVRFFFTAAALSRNGAYPAHDIAGALERGPFRRASAHVACCRRARVFYSCEDWHDLLPTLLHSWDLLHK